MLSVSDDSDHDSLGMNTNNDGRRTRRGFIGYDGCIHDGGSVGVLAVDACRTEHQTGDVGFGDCVTDLSFT